MGDFAQVISLGKIDWVKHVEGLVYCCCWVIYPKLKMFKLIQCKTQQVLELTRHSKLQMIHIHSQEKVITLLSLSWFSV